MRYVVLQAAIQGHYGPKTVTVMVEEGRYEENLIGPEPFSVRDYFPVPVQEALLRDAEVVDKVDVESDEWQERDYMPDVLISD